MKKYFAAALMASALLVASGCGAEQSEPSTEAQIPQGEQSTVTGTMDEIKDFMFVVTDEAGASYGFDFEERPEGLDDVAVGDMVTVTYTGEVSAVDPFEGDILSIEEAN